MMQLDWIRTFVTLAQLQHFTKTSDYLNLSQPTVSVHIKKLEQTIGAALIYRSSTNQHFELTPAGERVFEQGKKMMELWRTMEQVNQNNQEIQLRIGSTHTVSDVLLPDFVKKIKVLYPQVRLQLMIHNHETIVEALNSKEIDLALVEGTKGLEPFHVEVISRDELRFFASARMKLHSSPFIFREKGSGTREYADDFLRSERIVPVEILEASSHFLIKQLAVRGLGIAFLSSSMVKDEVLQGKLVPIEPYVIHRPFYAVHPENANSISVIKELISLIEPTN
ncbi:LysR family transcriptional regulator [Rossellomorea arthrocnemi]|jgi:LysR family transcriptional regulator, transcriptional activator of the cysJI operon|uniref:LysR family transcriptional regulator n=1 Tax=Rossellomorea arthrocnemi TaxID=2769542 RepID=UPI001918606E|nr:LysR family transcriptional regulator [Rossellomorea arthrocnemi]